ncbi:MAG: calcium-binding protein [Paracoccaceae bacterium]|nr:calcium-binding protein [Paracoccaceae bacterium]MDG1372853.1 calcium-binding protein [Paracoccaceae bacterium]
MIDVERLSFVDLTLTGDDIANLLSPDVATSGGDFLRGDAGADVFLGMARDDTINGMAGNDNLRGGGGRDKLNGAQGDDTLTGGGGADTLLGGFGVDEMRGGGGADVFQFRSDDGFDRITDFQQGRDKIEIVRGADDFGDLSISQVGDDVRIAFANVRIVVEDDNDGAFSSSDFIF